MFSPLSGYLHAQLGRQCGHYAVKNTSENTRKPAYATIAAGDTLSSSGPGLQEQACLLPQEVPFVTAARLLDWRMGEPDILCPSTLRTLVRDHGGRIRRLEQSEAVCLLSQRCQGRLCWPLRSSGPPSSRV